MRGLYWVKLFPYDLSSLRLGTGGRHVSLRTVTGLHVGMQGNHWADGSRAKGDPAVTILSRNVQTLCTDAVCGCCAFSTSRSCFCAPVAEVV